MGFASWPHSRPAQASWSQLEAQQMGGDAFVGTSSKMVAFLLVPLFIIKRRAHPQKQTDPSPKTKKTTLVQTKKTSSGKCPSASLNASSCKCSLSFSSAEKLEFKLWSLGSLLQVYISHLENGLEPTREEHVSFSQIGHKDRFSRHDG